MTAHQGASLFAGLLAPIAAAASLSLPEKHRYNEWEGAIDRATESISVNLWPEWPTVFVEDWCGEWGAR